MADEKKKPWQFSLKRMLGAMTLICVTLAISGAFFSVGSDNLIIPVMTMGLGIAVGIVIGGKKGVLAAILLVLTSFGAFILLAILLHFIQTIL